MDEVSVTGRIGASALQHVHKQPQNSFVYVEFFLQVL